MFINSTVIVWKRPKIEETDPSELQGQYQTGHTKEDTVIMPNVVENDPPYQNCTFAQSPGQIAYETVEADSGGYLQQLEAVPQQPYEQENRRVSVVSVEQQQSQQQGPTTSYGSEEEQREDDFLSIVNFIHNL